MKFPTSQTAVAKLAEMMFRGYYQHSSDFPNVNRARFYSEIQKYQAAVKKQLNAVSAFRIASEDKTEKLRSLVSVMKNCIKKSIVDTKANPEKLKLIGWGTINDSHRTKMPNQPTDLQIAAKDNAAVQLSWSRPAGRQRIINYIIERREETDGNFTKWAAIANSYKTQIILAGQPHGIKLEYRIKAINTSGQSQASNTVSVII